METINLFKPNIVKESIEGVSEVLRSGWIGLGPKTHEFEKRFAEYVGAKYCVALNSCTSALHLAIKLLDLPPNSEVITTPMTFVSTNAAILYERLVPKFVDIEYGTLNIDASKIERSITKNTGAIMCVHYSGQPCDMDEIYDIANGYGLSVIEDSAHACGASYKGRKIGTSGVCCWSFHAVKNLPVGDGGAITLSNDEDYNRLMRLRWLGINKDTWSRSGDQNVYTWLYEVDELGYKYHMNDITAAIGIGQLKYIDEHNSIRKSIVERYLRTINTDKVLFHTYKSDRESSNHTFPIKTKNRDGLLSYLSDNGINCGVHYVPNHMFHIFGKQQSLPVAESVYNEILLLPLHTLLSDSDVDKICKLVNNWSG